MDGCDPDLGCGEPGGGDDIPPSPTQADPSGTYTGHMTISSWSGADTSRCAQQTPTGFQLFHYIRIVAPSGSSGIAEFERQFPCEVTNASPASFAFFCVNHSLDEVCSPASQYWDPVAGNCDAYYERREFNLTFSMDGKHATGTVKDTRNWGGCSVREWSAVYDYYSSGG